MLRILTFMKVEIMRVKPDPLSWYRKTNQPTMQKVYLIQKYAASALLNPNTGRKKSDVDDLLPCWYNTHPPEKWYVVKTCFPRANRDQRPIRLTGADPWSLFQPPCDCMQLYRVPELFRNLQPYEQDLVQVRTVVQYACSKIAQCEWTNTLISNLCDCETKKKTFASVPEEAARQDLL